MSTITMRRVLNVLVWAALMALPAGTVRADAIAPPGRDDPCQPERTCPDGGVLERSEPGSTWERDRLRQGYEVRCRTSTWGRRGSEPYALFCPTGHRSRCSTAAAGAGGEGAVTVVALVLAVVVPRRRRR